MMPKTIASAGTIPVQLVDSPMIPSISDATQKPLLAPAASSVVPSIVNGIPQLLQLLEVMGLRLEHRGHWIDCPPPDVRRILGARSPAAAYACTGCGSCLMICCVTGSISRP